MPPITLPAEPYAVTPDTWIIPTFAAIPGAGWAAAHSMVVTGSEPVVVDTGSSLVGERWLADVASVVDPGDVRWIFVSHDDHDHIGNLRTALETFTNATLVASFTLTGRLGLEIELPVERMRWRDPGDSFDAGDRTFHLVRPPMFDSPATRGLYDEKTGVLWAVDSFGSRVPGAVFERGDVPDELFDGSFDLLNGWNTPWIEWLDVDRYTAHVDTTRSLAPGIVASAHGPVLRGAQVDDAFRRTLDLAATPPAPTPGQETLDQLLVEALAA